MIISRIRVLYTGKTPLGGFEQQQNIVINMLFQSITLILLHVNV